MITIEIKAKQYEIDLARMSQKNIQTNYKRPVMRAEGAQWVDRVPVWEYFDSKDGLWKAFEK
jgi:hypothetical protein